MIEKKPGRPREFDPDEVALKAVDVFWEKGFDGASLDDLTEALGISRPSLYAAFGDKRGLFLAAIDAYGRHVSDKAFQAFAVEPDIRRAVRRFFEVALDNATQQNRPKGCLVGQAAVSSVTLVDEVGDALRAMSLRARGHLAGRFDRERLAGDLPEGFESEERAALMIELMQGQAHRARIGDSREEIASGLPLRVATVLT